MAAMAPDVETIFDAAVQMESPEQVHHLRHDVETDDEAHAAAGAGTFVESFHEVRPGAGAVKHNRHRIG